MYGGDGRTLELRPSEFKGMLRFWWRALHPELPLDEIRRKEGEIFGNTDWKNSFRIKVKLISEKRDKNINLKNISKSGINYLFYSMFLGENKHKEHFYPQTRFELTFIFQNDKYIEDVLKSFWLLTYLGGLGSRNRRGAGSFKIIGFQDDTKTIKNTNLDFLIDTEDIFIKNLKKITPSQRNFEKYINLCNFSLYQYENVFNNWENALDIVGINLRDFRNRKDPDYTSVKEFILNGKTGKVLRPAFGLPLQFRYRSLSGESAKLEGSNRERQRSASPLFIKILKFNGKYKPVLIFFKKELLPHGDKIKISSKNQQRNKFLDTPNLSIIDDFINELINTSKIQEVSLNGQ